MDGLAPLAVTKGRLPASLMLAPGTPAVQLAVDGLAPLAVTKGRLPAPLLLAPGTPAVPLAFDGLAPLAVTFSPCCAARLLAARVATPAPVALLGPFGTLYVRSIHPS